MTKSRTEHFFADEVAQAQANKGGAFKSSSPRDFEPSQESDFGSPKHDCFPFIPEGIYEVILVEIDRSKRGFGPGETRTFFRWEISDMGPHHGTIVFQSFKDYKSYGSRSKYYHDWVIATGRRPTKREKMKPHVFKGKVFRALVRMVKPVYQLGPLKGQEMPPAFHYSVVDSLIEKVTG